MAPSSASLLLCPQVVFMQYGTPVTVPALWESGIVIIESCFFPQSIPFGHACLIGLSLICQIKLVPFFDRKKFQFFLLASSDIFFFCLI